MKAPLRTLLVVLLAAAVAVPVALAAVRGTGYSTARVSLAGGVAWLSSPGQSLLTLVDGPSELVLGSVRVGSGTVVDRVVQVGGSALLLDTAAGTVTRVDGATYDVAAPVRFAPAGPLDVVSGSLASGSEPALYVLGGDRAASVDPGSLAVRREVPLQARPGAGQAVVDGAGRLWVVDGATGDLVGVGPSGEPARSASVGPSAKLVVVQGRPAVVDPAQQRAGFVDDDGDVGSWTCLPADPAADTRLLGSLASPRLYAASAATGTVTVSDLSTGDCGTAVTIGRPGQMLGEPVESGGFLLVPNETTGHVSVVDPVEGASADLPVLPDPVGRLELVARDGLVFYNDLVGDRAGVLDLRGGQWSVGPASLKYVAGDLAPDAALLDSGGGAIPPDRPPAGVPPARDRPATGPAGGPGPLTAPVVTPTTRSPVVTTAPPDTEVTLPSFGDTSLKRLSAVRGSIESRIRTACGDGTLCVGIGTRIVPAGESLVAYPSCTITQVPAGGTVPRGGTVTFGINSPCDGEVVTDPNPSRPVTSAPVTSAPVTSGPVTSPPTTTPPRTTSSPSTPAQEEPGPASSSGG